MVNLRKPGKRGGNARESASRGAVMRKGTVMRKPGPTSSGSGRLPAPQRPSVAAIAAAIPHARLALVHGCGHMLTMEKPAEVNAALAAWLARVA